MPLPSLDQIRRNAEKLRADVLEPPEERGYPFGYVPPELEEMYEEWRERDPDPALLWRTYQPGFNFPEVIRRCAAALDDEDQAEIMRRNEEHRRESGIYDDEDPELEAHEPAESADLDRLDEDEERENQAVNGEAECPPEPQAGPETAPSVSDVSEPAPEPPDPPQARDQTRTPNQATPGSPWNPHPRQSLRDQLKGWL